MNMVKNIQNSKWELPTLSLLYNSKNGISQCDYKVYDLMSVQFHHTLPFHQVYPQNPTIQPIKKVLPKQDFFTFLIKGDVELNINIKSEELLRWYYDTVYKINMFLKIKITKQILKALL